MKIRYFCQTAEVDNPSKLVNFMVEKEEDQEKCKYMIENEDFPELIKTGWEKEADAMKFLAEADSADARWVSLEDSNILYGNNTQILAIYKGTSVNIEHYPDKSCMITAIGVVMDSGLANLLRVKGFEFTDVSTGTMCKTYTENKVDVADALMKELEGKAKIYIDGLSKGDRIRRSKDAKKKKKKKKK